MTLTSGINHIAILTCDLERFIQFYARSRGHLDHLALSATSVQAFETIRNRLVEQRASNGAVEDLGAFCRVDRSQPLGRRVDVLPQVRR
jgi:catechol 2,3-dioxygenase-like lactoylglutathione lyase family enzyme